MTKTDEPKAEGVPPVWVAPELVELRVGMDDVENGFAVGSDGDDPGFPFTSES